MRLRIGEYPQSRLVEAALVALCPLRGQVRLDRCGRLDNPATTMDSEQLTEDFVDMLDQLIHDDRGESRV